VLRGRVIGAVLAGGAGRRIGGDKATVELDGRPLLHYPLAVAREALGEVVVVAKEATLLPRLDADVTIWMEDDEPRHPLTGIVQALRNARGAAVVVVAGDMPFVTVGLLRALAGAGRTGALAVVPRGAGHLQPLCARYEAAALSTLADFDPKVAVTDAVAGLRPRILDWHDDQPFFNVNGPEDLLHASALLPRR
jgi:molybdenum cofactor guanylyltransferase